MIIIIKLYFLLISYKFLYNKKIQSTFDSSVITKLDNITGFLYAI